MLSPSRASLLDLALGWVTASGRPVGWGDLGGAGGRRALKGSPFRWGGLGQGPPPSQGLCQEGGVVMHLLPLSPRGRHVSMQIPLPTTARTQAGPLAALSGPHPAKLGKGPFLV